MSLPPCRLAPPASPSAPTRPPPTHGIIKQDSNGHLDGSKSPLALPTGVHLLIYTPVGTQAEEYDLLRFEEHKDSREFRVKTGGVFHSETGSERDEIEFHPVKVAKDMYAFNAGKIFTFSIRE